MNRAIPKIAAALDQLATVNDHSKKGKAIHRPQGTDRVESDDALATDDEDKPNDDEGEYDEDDHFVPSRSVSSTSMLTAKTSDTRSIPHFSVPAKGTPSSWSLTHKFTDRPTLPTNQLLTSKVRNGIKKRHDRFLLQIEKEEQKDAEDDDKQNFLGQYQMELAESAQRITRKLREIDDITLSAIDNGKFINKPKKLVSHAPITLVDHRRSSIAQALSRTRAPSLTDNQQVGVHRGASASQPSFSGTSKSTELPSKFMAPSTIDENDNSLSDNEQDVEVAVVTPKRSQFGQYLDDQLLRKTSGMPLEFYSRSLHHNVVHKQIQEINEKMDESGRFLKRTLLDLGIEDREKQEKDIQAEAINAQKLVDQFVADKIRERWEFDGERVSADSILSPDERQVMTNSFLIEIQTKRKNERAARKAAGYLDDVYDSDDDKAVQDELDRCAKLFDATALEDCRLPGWC
jgi:hypothetical protein